MALPRGTINLVDGTIDTLTLSSRRHRTHLERRRQRSTWRSATSTATNVALTTGGLASTARWRSTSRRSTTVSAGTYNLMTFTGGVTSGSGSFYLNLESPGCPARSWPASNTTANAEQLIIAPGIPATAYWTGTRARPGRTRQLVDGRPPAPDRRHRGARQHQRRVLHRQRRHEPHDDSMATSP